VRLPVQPGPQMITHAVGHQVAESASDSADINRRSAKPWPMWISARLERPERFARPHNATRETTGTLTGLVLKSRKSLLPLVCVYLISATIGYAMNAAALGYVSGTANGESASAESITPRLGVDRAIGVAGFEPTPSVVRLPYLGLGIEAEQDPQTPSQLQAATQ
jgi:hypothetical protein